MKTDLSSSRSEQSLIGNLFAAFTASLGLRSSSEQLSRLASSLAAELQSEPGAAELVISLVDTPRCTRSSALLRAARYFRGDWNTFGVADALRRLVRPELFNAVVEELRTATAPSGIAQPAMSAAVFAEVA